MKVQRESLDLLFTSLGAKTASKWPDKRMLQKVGELPAATLIPLPAGPSADLLKKLIAASEAGTLANLEIISENEEAPAKPSKAKAKAAPVVEAPVKAKAGKGKAKAAPAEEDEDEDEAPTKAVPKKVKAGAAAAKAPKAPKAPAAPKGPKPPGVIATILEILKAASSKKPVTKAIILQKLTAKFPERDPESMVKTVNVQVPTRLRSDAGADVQRNEEGYWAV